MAEWRVNLHGDDFDLSQLAGMLTATDVRIRQEEGLYFLVADRFNDLEDAEQVRKKADEVLRSLNGLIRLRLRSQQPISVANLQRVEDEGKTHHYILTDSGTLSIREGLTIVKIGAEGTTESVQQEDDLVGWFSLADKDETVARVLNLFGNVVQTWKDLYPIYEIIESDVGGEDSLVSKGWTSRNQIERFSRTSNHSQAAGDGARHGVSRAQPPSNPMTPAEGRAFIESLMTSWLRSKQPP